jgi:hypothetical protein
MPTNYQVAETKKENPMLGLIGFIILVVVGGFSFAVSGPALHFLRTAHVTVGMSGIKLLPLEFPANWSPLANQMAVAFGIFLVVFAIAMIILFLFMKPSTQDEYSVSLDVMRREVEARKKVR